MVGHAAGQPSRPACAGETSTAESDLAAGGRFRSRVESSASGLVHADQHSKGFPARCAQERRAQGRSLDIEDGRSRAAYGPSGSQGSRIVGRSIAVGPRPGPHPLPAQNLDWTGGCGSCFPGRGYAQVYVTEKPGTTGVACGLLLFPATNPISPFRRIPLQWSLVAAPTWPTAGEASRTLATIKAAL